MTKAPSQPPVHSQADPLTADGRLSAPAAVRNAPHIVAALEPYLPESGAILEIAAGTGEHAVALARAYPRLVWHPTDISAQRRASIDAWARAEGLANIQPARHLDASRADWHTGSFASVYLSNLLHLLPDHEATHVISGAARALDAAGYFCLYGPFRDAGGYRSEADATFDAALRASDPLIGYKTVSWVCETAAHAGLALHATVEMPANNLVLVFKHC